MKITGSTCLVGRESARLYSQLAEARCIPPENRRHPQYAYVSGSPATGHLRSRVQASRASGASGRRVGSQSLRLRKGWTALVIGGLAPGDSLAAKLDLLPNHFFADAVASVPYLSRGLAVSWPPFPR
jgi:hypothetical protein